MMSLHGGWLLARGVRAHHALVLSVLVVAGFSLLPSVNLPAGILSADEPAVMPLHLIQPILLAMALVPACLSAAAVLEATAARAVRLWHVAVLAAVVAVTAGMLALQPNLPTDALPRTLVSYAGSLGLALVGAALLGALGLLVPAAYLLLLTVIGSVGFGEPAVWAWSLQPLEVMTPVAAALLALGAGCLAVRWARPVGREDA